MEISFGGALILYTQFPIRLLKHCHVLKILFFRESLLKTLYLLLCTLKNSRDFSPYMEAAIFSGSKEAIDAVLRGLGFRGRTGEVLLYSQGAGRVL